MGKLPLITLLFGSQHSVHGEASLMHINIIYRYPCQGFTSVIQNPRGREQGVGGVGVTDCVGSQKLRDGIGVGKHRLKFIVVFMICFNSELITECLRDYLTMVNYNYKTFSLCAHLDRFSVCSFSAIHLQ